MGQACQATRIGIMMLLLFLHQRWQGWQTATQQQPMRLHCAGSSSSRRCNMSGLRMLLCCITQQCDMLASASCCLQLLLMVVCTVCFVLSLVCL